MRNAILFIAVALLSLSACKPNFDDDSNSGDFTRGWDNTNIKMIKQILNAHASEEELLLISDTEFFRVGPNSTIIEQRPVNDLIYGRPILSDDVYAYVKKDGNFKDMISFHLVDNPNDVVEISVGELSSESGQTIIFETNTRTPGVFSDDGTQFALPALVFPDFNYHFFIFDIKLNAEKTAFTDVTLLKEVAALEMPAEFGSLTNMRFIDGLFYASAYTGGFRFNAGMNEADQIFSHWTLDFFKKDGMYYSTGLFFNDFFISESGEHWSRMWHESTLNNVEMVDGELFSHTSLGWRFLFVEDLAAGSEIFYPSNFPDDNSLYNSVVKFDGEYFMTVENELHSLGAEVPLR